MEGCGLGLGFGFGVGFGVHVAREGRGSEGGPGLTWALAADESGLARAAGCLAGGGGLPSWGGGAATWALAADESASHCSGGEPAAEMSPKERPLDSMFQGQWMPFDCTTYPTNANIAMRPCLRGVRVGR